MEKTKCLQCNKEIDRYSSFLKNGKIYYKKKIKKYCSLICSSLSKKKIYKIQCLNCNKLLESKNKTRNFCSHKCSGEYLSKNKTYKPIHKKYKKKNKEKNKCLECKINTARIKFCYDCSSKKEKNRAIYRYKIKKNKARILKEKLINNFGGRCISCGYNKCQRALTFHHIDPKTKKFTIDISNLIKKKESDIMNEVKKCQLLCQNCHSIHHEKERIINNKIKNKKYNNKKILIQSISNKCQNCNFNTNYIQAMTFHHNNKINKKFELNSVNINIKEWEEILEEADKCSLLCFNCHMEKETELYEQSINNTTTF